MPKANSHVGERFVRSVLRGLGSRGAADRGDRGPFIDKRISFGTEFLLIFSCRLLFCSSLTVAASAELVVVPSVFEFEAIPGFSMEEIFMLRLNQRAGSLVISIVAMLLSVVGDVHAQAGVKTFTGSFADGATYLIDVPANWNGTLLLYSHGYVIPGTPNPAHDVGDPLTRSYLLSNGYALAGSSYATTGWAVEQALPDQIAVLDTFNSLVGQPSRTIAWGHSLGGMVTAGLVQRFPERFSAALPMCGVLAGGVGTWNVAFDVEFAFNVLLAQGTLQVVNITDPLLNLGLAEAALTRRKARPKDEPALRSPQPLATRRAGSILCRRDLAQWISRLRKPTSFCGCSRSIFPLSSRFGPTLNSMRRGTPLGIQAWTIENSWNARLIWLKWSRSTKRLD